MLDSWTQALVFLLLSFAVPIAMLVVGMVLRVRSRRKTSPIKHEIYECGEEPDGPAWIRFHPRYYVVALVFVLFDVEAAFLFPWALGIRDNGWLAIADMTLFLGILVIGWAYAVRKGAIQWQ
ncbi:MAG: NADH-quinone oxidoreductase subunit A [Deltaproteobacteria bacterium]|nr:NADH-quinone oxidoreductase subunit A [Deltaproteobacteria bacterium]